ncbi:site-specific DNA-methyltransferase [Aquabacterium soli]|uniref:site-specific DNA-methyltransferase (adenine-specific) n=2 Tax=Aquabacterium soli TaxID=2493092 RepID=A0A3R8RYV2_9BURK|nr:DNA methyltransferase [Aquabacterium soli]RRS01098.1 site-specific DNA-methyltransferase [Aquabacterium soli]
MQKIAAGAPEAQSADLVAGTIAQLKDLFPELVTEGPKGSAINLDVLKALVGDATVTDVDEKYGLNWHGKRRARQLALTPSTGTLRPCPEESVDWDSTQNLMIEGDNLEVLKLLQKSYAGKVKLIYIDPPYNTGNDFVYPDSFQNSIQNYLELTGQTEEGQKTSSNTEASGRFHTDWLNMLYPRLKLARNLLQDDGVLCVSIDDVEQANLRKVCDDLFGEENHVATIVWQKRYVSNATAKWLSDMHDFIVVYAKNKETLKVNSLERTEEQLAAYKNPDKDARGVWRAQDLSASKPYSAGMFTITGPTGNSFDPPPNRYWRCNKEQFDKWVADGRIWWGVNKDARPMLKAFLAESERGVTPNTWWDYGFAGHNKEATLELKELFDGDAPFDTPKPVRLMRRLIELFCGSDDLVLDFFCGSASFGHAAMECNAAGDDSALRFILVQLPEPVTRVGYQTIADISKERLRRARSKVKADYPAAQVDAGFRVFKLDESNIRAWMPKATELGQSLLDHQEHLQPDRTEQDLLYELLLKLGLDLCVPIQQQMIAGKSVYAVGAGVLLACLAESITTAEVETLAEGIVQWYQQLAPAGDTTCVFRDSAFGDDVAKTNMAAILQQHGIQNVRSL